MRTAWMVVLLLIPVALLNYLDRQMLASMKKSMTTDLTGFTHAENWGIVLGSFKWVYAALSPVCGYIADRWSRRHIVVASLIIWSAVTLATGYVTNYPELVAARALMGISEAFYIPTALAMISDFHPSATRSRAVGLHQMGMYAGIILGGFAGYVADDPQLGWRWAFNVCGIVGIIYALPLMFLLQNPPAESRAANRPEVLTTAKDLLTNVNFILLVLCFTLPAIAGWVVKDWMPEILRERFNLQQGVAGKSAVVSVQLASLAGALLGGWLADKWSHFTIRGRTFVSAIGMTFFLPSLFGVGNSTSLAMAVTFLVVFGLGWGLFDCNNMPILCQIVRPQYRATGYGVMNCVSIGCGGFADWGYGILKDHNVPLNVTFGVFAGIALLSALLMLMIRPTQPADGSGGH